MLPVTLRRERCARYLTWRLVLESMVWNIFNHREACSQSKWFCQASSGKSLVLVVRGNPRVPWPPCSTQYSICQSEEYSVPMSDTHTKMHSMSFNLYWHICKLGIKLVYIGYELSHFTSIYHKRQLWAREHVTQMFCWSIPWYFGIIKHNVSELFKNHMITKTQANCFLGIEWHIILPSKLFRHIHHFCRAVPFGLNNFISSA